MKQNKHFTGTHGTPTGGGASRSTDPNGGNPSTGHTGAPNPTPPPRTSNFAFGTKTSFGSLIDVQQPLVNMELLVSDMRDLVDHLPDVKIIGMNRKLVDNLAYSCILATYTHRDVLYYHTMLLADSGDIVKINPMGRDNQNPIVPSDALDGVLLQGIRRQLDKIYPNIDPDKVIPTGEVVIPKWGESHEDEDTPIEEILANALRACGTAASLADPQQPDIQLSREAMGDVSLTLDIDCVSKVNKSITGQPVKTMFTNTLSVKSRAPEAYTRSINYTENSKEFLKVGGFLDVLPRMVDVNGLQVVRCVPELVINAMDGDFLSPAGCLLGLAVAASAKTNNLWMEMLRNTPATDNDMHNAGALNYMTNLEGNESGTGKKVDLNDGTPTEINTVMSQMFTTGVAISMDVDVGGPSSWFMNLFTNPSNKELILRSAASLTGNSVVGSYNGGIVTSIIQVPTGYWIDNNGQIRDIKDVGLIAIANGFNGDSGAINQWLLAGGYQGYNKRCDLIKTLLPGAVIQGWSMRVTFNSAFIELLEWAVSESGFIVNLQAPHVTGAPANYYDVASGVGSAITSAPSPILGAQHQGLGGWGAVNGYNTGWGYA